MAFVHGKKTKFFVDNAGGTLADISQYCDNVSGLPGSKDLSEVTAFGDDGTRYVKGLENSTFSISGHYDPTATTGPNAILAAAYKSEDTVTFEHGPEGDDSGATKFTGEAHCNTYTVESSVSDKVSFSAEFQVDGVVELDTFT